MELPDAIKRAALFPESDQPDYPPGHPNRRISIEEMPVVLPDGLPFVVVYPERLDASRIEPAVQAARTLARDEERRHVFWFVPEAESPEGFTQHLLSLGMRPNDLPGSDARNALMVCLAPPPAGPSGLVARRVETFDEFLTAQFIVADSFELDDEVRRAMVERAERAWPLHGAPGTHELFVALVDGEVGAVGAARYGRNTVYLAGGGTHPDHRGRGAYRALVRARWDAAVERDTPALTVGAGLMSRPILERAGFSIVGWEDVLLDEIA